MIQHPRRGASNPLHDLIRRELFADVIRHLHPLELLIALLRVEGLTDLQIARELGTTRPTVTRLMLHARRRIARQVPGAADLLGDRDRRRLLRSEARRTGRS
jgi:DNA-directed RNA polymerase specialized sigma24 family protein